MLHGQKLHRNCPKDNKECYFHCTKKVAGKVSVTFFRAINEKVCYNLIDIMKTRSNEFERAQNLFGLSAGDGDGVCPVQPYSGFGSLTGEHRLYGILHIEDF